MRSVISLMVRLPLAVASILLGVGNLAGQPTREDPDKARIAAIADLKSSDVETRRSAAIKLGSIPQGMKAPRRMPDAVAALIEALKDPDPTVRANAVESLAHVGGRYSDRPSDRPEIAKNELPAVLAAIKDPDPVVRAKVAVALAQIDLDGKAALPALTSLVDDPTASVRVAAVRGLGNSAIPAAAIREPVLRAINDRDADVRVAAMGTLRRVGLEKEGVASAMIAALRDPSHLVQRMATSQAGDESVPVLLEQARDKGYPNRVAAVQAIGRIGPDAKIAVPALMEALKDSEIQAVAADAIARYGAEAKPAIPILREVAAAKPGGARRQAVLALIRIDPAAEETWSLFKDLSAVDRRGTTSTLLRADRQVKEKWTARALLYLLQDPDVKERAKAVYMLDGKTLPADVQAVALPLLLTMLKNGEAPAADLAGALGPMKALAKEAVPDLLKAYKLEKDFDAREQIYYALQRIDPEAAKKAGSP